MQMDNCDLTRELDEIVRKDSNYSGKKSKEFTRMTSDQRVGMNSGEDTRTDFNYNNTNNESHKGTASKPKKKKTRRKKKDKAKFKKMKKLKNMERNNSYDTRGPQT